MMKTTMKALCTAAACTAAAVLAGAVPDTIILDGAALQRAREEINAGGKRYDRALKALRKEADRWLDQPILTVMDKQLTPPSGDKHDWMSWGIYWWPDPARPDGKPYIHKDGRTNPETQSDATDAGTSKLMFRGTLPLALTWFYTGEEKYAAKAAAILRAWYVDPATRMNPHLEYGEGIPGICDGRPTGIITFSLRLHAIVDAARLLAGSEHWSAADAAGLNTWFAAYLRWLETAKIAREERHAANNHATWFAAHLALLKLHLGDPAGAGDVLAEAIPRLLPKQFSADGNQPLEMARTRSLDYSTMNLAGFLNLARLGDLVGFDVWNYRTPDGVGLPAAMHYMIPFAADRDKWGHQQIVKFNRNSLDELLQRLSLRPGETVFTSDNHEVKTRIDRTPIILKYPSFPDNAP